MEGAEMERKDEAIKSQIAIRCAKAAILLSSLKSSPNLLFKTTNNDQDEEAKERMMREIRDLKMELVKERMKSKRIKMCSLMEVILQVMLVLSISTLLLVLAYLSH